ncbi:hypothetical protein EYR97_09450 [Alteromonas sp. KUL42]|uniref:hypothetical protein n=1 Tax=Alteromonas sp. KUL42 TaxID=2480797 RepID=UPI001036D297|nr:hypothetical protein [Alteromonas sp. KUL42]TAP35670.1 hypothetical protein EYR97_09450 [Alteromonas sp. KUL42]
MTERKLIDVLTTVCEEEKKAHNGFVWLTHEGHWRSPNITAVFDSQAQLNTALSQGWDMDFINKVNIALASIKSRADSINFASEEACKKFSGGNWQVHLTKAHFTKEYFTKEQRH